MRYARDLIGTREIAGAGNNSVIMGWGRKLGAKILGIPYDADATPWCGLFAAYAVASAGLKPPPIAIRAKAWATWGDQTSPAVGAILVFQREGGGHVGFYESEDATAYHVLGGNQSDSVSVTRIAKTRCIAVRWPSNVPKTTAPRVVKPTDLSLSKNEA